MKYRKEALLMSKKKKSVMKNYIYNMLYEILAIIIPLITTPYLSRILGAENIGIYGKKERDT